MEIKFEKERGTKHTIRYKEIGDPPKIGILYVKRWALEEEFKGFPEKLTVSINET